MSTNLVLPEEATVARRRGRHLRRAARTRSQQTAAGLDSHIETRVPAAEEELIRKCRTGDAEACAELVTRYASLIYSVPLHNFGMSQEDAEDIFQMCFIKVMRRARQFRGESRFSAWLRTVVRNICVDCIRSQKRAVSLEEIREGCELCPLSTVCSADTFVKQAEERLVLENALADLPDHYRRPIKLFFFESKSYREISEILGEPVNTVGTHINRGLARLRKDLSANPDSVEALLAP